ncbi:NAD(P)H-quinone oxidoreductase subunit U, chloroplastic [Iris pallida]|uniref:NAD(P)H-quinone oxidoreductase subunit U, chloroplastic n=1 Tax=Iris pallida TaxID=29817 RepID=A0AAX6I6J0_IRIPA|nr:NAD(P)H-quinone oxidoreductase subunit U, chloroplastic [Iris pallida]
MATTVGFPSPAVRFLGRRPIPTSLPRAKHLAVRVRCSAEPAADAAAAATAEEEEDAAAVGTTKRSSFSLISTENVQKALRGVAITNADHYGRLGLAKGCSYDQVKDAYEKKCEELSNQELDEDKVSTMLELLKESYEILSSEDERRLYDWSLARSENPDRYIWPFEVDITQTPTESPPPEEPEDEGPTRLVGYFFLAWFILSVVLSVTLNR